MLEKNPVNKPKMLKVVREFRGYIVANQAFIPSYGDRNRHEETISTAFVESTVNYVVSKRALTDTISRIYELQQQQITLLLARPALLRQ
ncbi:hypothetical protein OKW49_008305 [Paraburkholderia youngii]|uniref:hypothetical protein n=1 Tax=Paraburkholderia youngii TaxID=2782701 RepID=UPI003D2522B5